MNRFGIINGAGFAIAAAMMVASAGAPVLAAPPAPSLPRSPHQDDEDRHLARKRRQCLRSTGKAAELRNRTRGAGRL